MAWDQKRIEHHYSKWKYIEIKYNLQLKNDLLQYITKLSRV